MASSVKPAVVLALSLPLAACGGGTGGTSDAGGTCGQHLPAGFSQIVGSTTDNNLGAQVSMALDENDDPLFAWVATTMTTSTVYFARWDPCIGALTSPAAVDSGQPVNTDDDAREVSIAYDTSTHEVGIAYTKMVTVQGDSVGTTWLATRAAGASTFALQKLSTGESTVIGTGSPAIGMRAGNVYVAYTQTNYMCTGGTCAALWFLSSPPVANADGGVVARTFTPSEVQYQGGTLSTVSHDHAVSLAIDSAGAPGLAFIIDPLTGYNRSWGYWHQGMPQAVAVTDTHNIQNDSPDVSLAYFGTQPRIAGHLIADMMATYDLTYASSADGMTWSAPVRLPLDMTAGTAFTSALAVDPGGVPSVLADINTGMGTGMGRGGACGNPYLAQGNASGAAWTACGADNPIAHAYVATSLNAAYGSSRLRTTLVAAFHNSNTQGDRAGIVYWQHP